MIAKVLSALILVASSSLFAQAVPTELLPELKPRASLIGILKALDATIADPRSVTDIVLCPATRVKFDKAGRPNAKQVHFSMNSKSADGGYTGRTMFMAIFRDGNRTEILKTQLETDEGINKLINDLNCVGPRPAVMLDDSICSCFAR